MLTYLACEDVAKSRLRKAGRVIGFVVVAAVVMVAVFHIIIPSFVMIARGGEPPAVEPAVLSESDRVEHSRLLLKHGLLWDVAVIEEDRDGSLWFWRDGKRCQFK